MAGLSGIAPLAREHVRRGFDSGEPSLDAWLLERAKQAGKADSARTYVVCDNDRVVAYYSLCTYSVHPEEAEPEQRVGPFAIPSILLARLAVDRAYQGRSLGEELLVDALMRAVAVSEEVAVRLFVVHALHERAAQFYERYGFKALLEATPLSLYRSIADLRATFASC